MKTWNNFLEEVEFISRAFTLPTYITEDYTRKGSPESLLTNYILYEAQGTTSNWLAANSRHAHWCCQFGLFPSNGEYLQYYVSWKPNMFRFSKLGEQRFGKDILSLCK